MRWKLVLPWRYLALLALGLHRLSMAPSAVGPIKAMLRSLDIGRLSGYLNSLMDLPATSVRSELLAYARDHAVVI